MQRPPLPAREVGGLAFGSLSYISASAPALSGFLFVEDVLSNDPLNDFYSDDDLQRSCEDLWLPHRVEGGGEDHNLDQDGVGDQDHDGDGDDGDDGDDDGDSSDDIEEEKQCQASVISVTLPGPSEYQLRRRQV